VALGSARVQPDQVRARSGLRAGRFLIGEPLGKLQDCRTRIQSLE